MAAVLVGLPIIAVPIGVPVLSPAATASAQALDAVDDVATTFPDAPLMVDVLGNDTVPAGVGVVGPAFTYVAANDPDKGDAFWPRDSNAATLRLALSGFAFNPASGSTRSGLANSYTFTGTGGGVMEGYNSTIRSGSVSMEFWVRPSDLSGSEVIFESGGSGIGYALYLNGSQLVSGLKDPTLVEVSVDLLSIFADEASATNDFIHVVTVIDSVANTHTLYVNGAAVGSAGFTGAEWAGGDPTGLGQVNGTAAVAGVGSFEGDIASYRLYTSALTATQVRQNLAALSPLTVSSVTQPANGTVGIKADGQLLYTPDAGFVGQDTFTYTIIGNPGVVPSDGTATVTIDVTSTANIAPTAGDDTFTTPEDAPLADTLTGGDSDPESGTLNYTTTPVVLPSNGIVTIAVDGTFTYTPDADFNGTDTFEYEVCDDGSPVECDTAIATIEVTSVGDAPVAFDDPAATAEDGPVTIDVAGNDTDVESDIDPASVTIITPPTNGTAVANGDGTVTYTPNPDFNGTDTFTYQICDTSTPTPLCDTATSTVAVVAVADSPQAGDDPAAATAEDTPVAIDVAGNDSDVDGDLDPASVTVVGAPANGTATPNGDGTVTYTPDPDFNGTDTFTYQICDTSTPTPQCDTADVTVTVDPVADTPVAVDSIASTPEDTPLVVDVAANDIDIDGDLDPASVTITSPPANGTAVANGDGTVSYTPNANFDGVDTFEYQVCDTTSPTPLCDTATATIDVLPTADPPAATAGPVTTDEDAGTTIDVAALTTDPDGDIDPTSVAILVAPMNGTATANADGTVTYTPNPDFNGTDTFTYEICDQTPAIDGGPFCDNAVVTMTVDPVADAPSTTADPAVTAEDAGTTIDVAANDTDVDGDLDPASVTVVGGPANGTATPNGDGTITYTPDPDFNGTDTFTYQICDTSVPTPLCDTATVTVDVAGVNDAPVAGDDPTLTTPEDTLLAGTVATGDTDVDIGDTLVYTTTPVTDVSNGTLVLAADGTFSYDPDPDFSGTDSFVYEVCDTGTPVLCDTATVTIDVTEVNDAPAATDDPVTAPEDVETTFDVVANDTDPEGALDPASVRITTLPANGSAVVDPDGTIRYTGDPNYNGPDSFTYEVCDSAVPRSCDTADVVVDVTAVDDVPMATDDSAATPEDTLTNIDVVSNDIDVDGNLDPTSVTVTSPPANGTATPNGDGTLRYTPNPGYSGTDTFRYQICDTSSPSPLCDTAEVTVGVASVADVPIAGDDPAATTAEDTPVNIDVAANDIDGDGNLDPASVTVVGAPVNGTATPNGDGTVTYTPDPDFNGTDTFRYQICDTSTPVPLCDTADVTVDVSPVNDAPVALNDIASTDEDTPVNIDVAGADQDIESNLDLTSITIVTPPANGTATPLGDGTVDYVPDLNFAGVDSFEYQVCDTGTPPLCDTATVTLDVLPTADPPVPSDASATTDEDMTVSITLTVSDPDGDIDNASVTILVDPPNGTLVDNADGTVDYIPDPDFNGVDTFTYEICDQTPVADGGPFCDNAVVTVTVNPVNDAPVALDDAVATAENTLVPVHAASNDSDIDGDLDPASVSVTIGATNGTTALISGPILGTIGYTPNAGFEGTDTFTYEICDTSTPTPLCDTAVVTIDVAGVNDVPSAADVPGLTTDEDIALVGDLTAGDSDPEGNPLTYSATPLSPPTLGTVAIAADGTFTYTPNPDANGSDSFVYEVCDDGSPPLCDTATVFIDVIAVDDAPSATNDAPPSLVEDGSLTIDVAANDTDVDGDLDPASVTVVGAPANGTATPNGDGTITYTPDPDFNGTDTFTYQICDTSVPTPLCDTGEVNVTIAAANDAPALSVTDTDVAENDTVVFDATATDIDGDTEGAGLTYSLSGDDAALFNIDPDTGELTFIDPPDFEAPADLNGDNDYQVAVSVTDSGGLTDTVAVTITVTPVNESPIVIDGTFAADEDGELNADLGPLVSDPEGEAPVFTETPVSGPTNGTVSIAPDGTITYTPDPGFVGSDTFTFEACDRDGNCGTGEVTITVEDVNMAPQPAGSVAVETTDNVPVDGDLGPVASDPDGDPLTFTAIPSTPPSNGTVVISPDGTFTYLPDPGFVGTDSFVYEFCDPSGSCAEGSVEITVAASDATVTGVAFNDENDNGTNDNESPVEGVTIELQPAGTAGAAVVRSAATTGTVVTGPDGSFTFTNVTPGSYQLRATPPAGFVLTNAGGDSDFDPDTGLSASFEVDTALSLELGLGIRDLDSSLSATVVPQSALRVGQTTSWNVTVTNDGPDFDSGPIVATLTVPNGVIPTAAGGPGWACAINGQTVICTRAGELAADAFAAFTVDTDITAAAPDNVVLGITVTGGSSDPATSTGIGTITQPDPLAFTGSSSLIMVLIALTFVLAGMAILSGRRRWSIGFGRETR